MAKTFDIVNTEIRLFTVDANGFDLKELVGSTQYLANSIGELKRVELSFSTETYGEPQHIGSLSIYFSPALFYSLGAINPFNGNPPTEGWSYGVDPLATPGTYTMIQFVNPAYQTGLSQNYNVDLIINDEYNFEIHITYYQVYDLNAFLSSALEENRYKLLKDRANNPNILDVSGRSVYTSPLYIPQFYVCIKDDKNGTQINSNVIVQLEGYAGAFYAKSAHQAAPFFTDPIWILMNQSLTELLTTFRLWDDTNITFKITSSVPVTNIISWLIRVDSNDDSVDFLTNYEASIITSDVSSTTTDNKLIGPTTAIDASGAPEYVITFNVSSLLIEYGQRYRFIAIPYRITPSTIVVNSFISDEFFLDQLPNFIGTGYTFTGSITDYLNEWTGNDLICIVEERLRGKFNIDYSSDAFKDDILARLKLTVDNDIRKYLTTVMVEVYQDQSVQVRNYFDRIVATRIDPITYNVPSGLTLNFTTDNLEVLYDFRVRYEGNVLNTETTFNGVPMLTPLANQNWAGRDLFIKYSLTLYYDDYSTPFSDTITFIQKIHPKDYSDVITIMNSDGSPINDETYYCNDDNNCFKGVMDSPPWAPPQPFRFITTWELEPGSITTIEENEEFVGLLPQLQTDKVLTQDVSWGISANANVCIDNSKFLTDKEYKLSMIAKKV